MPGFWQGNRRWRAKPLPQKNSALWTKPCQWYFYFKWCTFFWLVQTVPGYKLVNDSFLLWVGMFHPKMNCGKNKCAGWWLVEGLPQSLEKLVELGSVRTIWCSFAHTYLKLPTQCILAMPVLINKRSQRELVGTYAHGTNLSCLLQKGCLWGKVSRAVINSHVQSYAVCEWGTINTTNPLAQVTPK